MRTIDIGSCSNMPKAQSQNTYMISRQTQEQMNKAIRDNYDLLDEAESGQSYGAFPFGYAPINTTR